MDFINTSTLLNKSCKFSYGNSFLYNKESLFINDENGDVVLNKTFNDYDFIFLGGDLIKYFPYMIGLINKKFILFSCYTDIILPYYKWSEPSNYEIILNNPNLVMWFGVNVDIVHPKITCIPIGIPDSFPFLEKNTRFPYMGWKPENHFNKVKEFITNKIQKYVDITNKNQEEILKRLFLREKTKFLYTRMTLENSDTIRCFHPYENIRRNIFEELKKKEIDVDENLIDFEEHIDELSTYKMILSPPGSGLDCFRTWESMYFGVIPICLRTKGMESLFENLPVILVDSFNEITKEYLYDKYISVINDIENDKINWKKLTNNWWQEKMTKICK